MSQLIRRIHEYRLRRGVRALAKGVWLRTYRRLFRNWHYVFMCDVVPVVPANLSGVSVFHCPTRGDLRDAFRQEIIEQLGPAMERTLDRELAGCAELFLALVDEHVAAMQYVRFGQDIRHWFLPLGPNDVVLFSGTTMPRFRGRGVMTWMIKHQTHYGLKRGGRAYADTKVWNTPAIRALEKVGYRRVARMRPLRPER